MTAGHSKLEVVRLELFIGYPRKVKFDHASFSLSEISSRCDVQLINRDN